MKHPAEAQLALFAGGDLGRWERWRLARHMARCTECRQEVAALQAAGAELRQFASEMPELPNNLGWNRLSQEITGNIRVGLAAGEAIALFDKPAASETAARLECGAGASGRYGDLCGRVLDQPSAAAGRSSAGVAQPHSDRTNRHADSLRSGVRLRPWWRRRRPELK